MFVAFPIPVTKELYFRTQQIYVHDNYIAFYWQDGRKSLEIVVPYFQFFNKSKTLF